MGPVIERLLADGALDRAKLVEGEEIADGAGLPLVRVLLHMKLVAPAAVAVALSAVTERSVVHLDKFPLLALSSFAKVKDVHRNGFERNQLNGTAVSVR